MESVTTERFRKSFDRLPAHIKEKANQAYDVWKTDPYNPSLHFKQLKNEGLIYSIRIGLFYRALGIREDDKLIWFWIGSHEEYNNLISKL